MGRNIRKSAVKDAEVVPTERIPPGDEPAFADDPPIDPPEDDEDDDGDDGPDEFESLENALDDLRGEIILLRKEQAIQVRSIIELTKALQQVTEKLGSLSGLGAIGKLFGR